MSIDRSRRIADVARIGARYPALAGLARELREAVEREAIPLSLAAGSVLFQERRACEAFPMVLEGSVRVSKSAANGRELQLYRVDPGESCILTASCLLGGRPYSARGVAESPVSLVLLPAPLFERLLDGHPPFRRHVFGLFAERLSGLMELVEEVAFRKLDQRLAALLAERAPVVRATHQAIADDLGSVREIVSRLLRAFADEGLVALRREEIQVLDAERLRRIAATER